MACAVRVKDCQHANAARLRGFDWADECANFRANGEIYEVNEVVRPAAATGFELKCTARGQTAAKEPDMRGLEDAAEVIDGSVTWVLQKTSAASLRKSITTSEWSVEPGGQMTASSPAIQNTLGEQKTVALLSAGTSGETYVVTDEVTFDDGTIAVGIYELEVD